MRHRNQQKTKILADVKVITRRVGRNSGSLPKITAPRGIALLLIVAVYSIIAVILNSIRVITSPILLNLWTIRSISTSIIYAFLKNSVTQTTIADTVICICGNQEPDTSGKRKTKFQTFLTEKWTIIARKLIKERGKKG